VRGHAVRAAGRQHIEPEVLAMRTSRLIGAVIALLIGLTFLGQGIGLIGGSAMSGSSFWAVAGAVIVIASVAFIVLERRRAARV
jgi:glucose dehydrogenase